MKTLILLLFILISFESFAGNRPYSPAMTVFININSQVPAHLPGTEDGKEWAQNFCLRIANALASEAEKSPIINCGWNRTGAMVNPEMQQARTSQQFSYLLEIDEKIETFNVRWKNWNLLDDFDFKQADWDFKNTDMGFQKFGKTLQNIRAYHENKWPMRQYIVAEALAMDLKNEILTDPLTGEVKKLNSVRDVTPEIVRHFVRHKPENYKYLQASIEYGIYLGGGFVSYVTNQENRVDWDFKDFAKALRAKFGPNGTGVRFDDNKFNETNYAHIYAGMAYAIICRGSGLSNLEALVCTHVASAIWENVVEFREVFSINDQIVTGFGGFILTEALYKISRIFDKTGNNILKKIFGALIKAPLTVQKHADQYLQNKAHLEWDPEAEPETTGTFEIIAGWESVRRGVRDDSSDVVIGFKAEAFSGLGVGEPGNVVEFIPNTPHAELKVEFRKNSSGMDQLEMFTKIVPYALNIKHMNYDEKGRLEGYQYFVGLSEAIQYSTQKNNGGSSFNDFLGDISVIGLSAHITMMKNGMKVTAVVDYFGDFAMIRSYAIDDYSKARGGLQGLPSVIRNYDYYYGIGTTARGALIFQLEKWTVAGEYRKTSVNAVTSHYRDQDTILVNPDLHDTIQDMSVSVKYDPTKNWSFKLTAGVAKRKGEIKNFGTVANLEKKVRFDISYHFD